VCDMGEGRDRIGGGDGMQHTQPRVGDCSLSARGCTTVAVVSITPGRPP
jgi:hypothetical protein